jgi:hypothetical protein
MAAISAGLLIPKKAVSASGDNSVSQMRREITTVLGATNVGVEAWVTDRDGRVLRADLVQGKVRFFGENLGVTNDLAKRIAKRLKQQ